MGYVSNRSRGYSKGYEDGFLNHVKRYRFRKFNLFFSEKQPEEQYVVGYNEGFAHGAESRIEYIDYTGKTPHTESDLFWYNTERQKLKSLLGKAQPISQQELINQRHNSPKEIVSLITNNRYYRALKVTEKHFEETGNTLSLAICINLLNRLESNRQKKANNQRTDEESKREIKSIMTSLESLIEEEYLPLYNNNSLQIQNEYLCLDKLIKKHKQEIEDVIVENWKIPKNSLPGLYEETFKRIIDWFSNFQIAEFEYMLSLLKRIEYFNADKIDNLLITLSDEIKTLFKNDFSNVAFFGLGSSANNSGSQFLYRIGKILELKPFNFPNDFNNIHSSVTSIVFIDDIIGTGNQATRFCNNYVSHLNSLDKYYFSLLAFKKGLDNVRSNSSFAGTFSAKILDEHNKAFSLESEIFRDSKFKKNVERVANKYGKILYPIGPLGYENSQSLIVFQHNTPNNTLPIIWASTNNEKTLGVPWIPLFERLKK